MAGAVTTCTHTSSAPAGISPLLPRGRHFLFCEAHHCQKGMFTL